MSIRERISRTSTVKGLNKIAAEIESADQMAGKTKRRLEKTFAKQLQEVLNFADAA